MSLALIALLPFLGALLAAGAARAGRGAAALAAGAATGLALLLLALQAPAVLRGEVVESRIAWVPSLGLNAHFMLDGLGLLFALLILGIGLLIILYSRFYLDAADPMGRFLTFLLLFQGAMLGIVLSDNILLLLIFWELTSLSSFLLIGFWSHLPEGRQGARMALVVTGAGGLALIAGLLILGQAAGSHDLSVIVNSGDKIAAHPGFLPALLLILLGCFTKSAQFPFHFWLPHAMAAPTPVSAYLHSATMVKAGIYLLARLWPVFAGSAEWVWIVTSAGVVTMLLGAVVALFKDDLKAVLAYSTVSHLGLITMLLGFGTKTAATAALLHVLVHSAFKAALFLCAGIVDHAAHTRDLNRLGGLRRMMPLTFAMVLVAGLSMAGVPPLSGFLSKEMMLDQAYRTVWLGPMVMAGVATFAAALSAGYSLRLIAGIFLGPVRTDYPAAPHDPSPGLALAPLLLVGVVVALGLVPMGLAGALIDTATHAVTRAPAQVELALWHGLYPAALWMSVAALGGGLCVFGLIPVLRRGWEVLAKPDAKRLFDAAVAVAAGTARRVTEGLHTGSLSRALALAVLTIVAGAVYGFLSGPHLPGTRGMTPVAFAPLAGWLLLVAATLAAIRLHRDRLTALILVSIVGLIVSVGFAYFSAPDLALTQITVEVVTLILMLMALHMLPRTTPAESSGARKLRDGVVAGVAGLGAGLLAYALMRRDFGLPAISAFHLEQSKPGAGGTNAVNTIIVDFRGYDTYGEIIVLGIAALVIFALTECILRDSPSLARLTQAFAGLRRAGGPYPQLMQVVSRFLLPMAMMVGVYLYLRGHNLPGGGFVAGLVFAIALVLQSLASGVTWAARRMPVDAHALIMAGVVVATACGIGAWGAGLPFLTSGYRYVTLPLLDPIELATASIFDLGVFLCVLGAVLLALGSLARVALRAAMPGRR